MKEEQVYIPAYMPHDDFQILLERYYKYGGGWLTRWSHRLRINCISSFIDSYAKKGNIHSSSSLAALDLGCGEGAYAYILAQRGFRTFAIDISREEILDALEWTSANLLLGDAERLPFKDNSFDLVICSEVIEHLSNPTIGMRELQRVLRFGGIAIISMPNLFSYYWLGSLAMTLARHFVRGEFTKLDIDAHMKSPFWEISYMVNQAGLKTLATRSVFFCLPLMGFCNHIPSTISQVYHIWERILMKTPLLRNFGAFYIWVCTKIH